jgi:hypothetical protein
MPDWKKPDSKKPDWKKLVDDRTASLPLPAESREEIVTELAAHLEDGYHDDLARGLTESEAGQRALSEVQWNALARRIRRATFKEAPMNSRVKGLWLPAIVNMLLAMSLFVICQIHPVQQAVRVAIIWLMVTLGKHGAHLLMGQVGRMSVALSLVPWFFTLPLSAAVASRLAKRAQAPPALRLIAGMAPSLAWLAVFTAMALEFTLDRWQFPAGFPLELNFFVLSAVCLIVLPALPLLVGTLPFLREAELRKAATQR